MTRRRKTAQVYNLTEMPEGVLAVVRYDGDPDVFTALAHQWLTGQRHYEDDPPVAVLPPEPRLYRMKPTTSDDYGWILGEAPRPGSGVWTGALLRTVQIGCSICHQLHGRHTEACLNEGVTGLVVLQFTASGRAGPGRFASEETIHAVRGKQNRGGVDTPGNTLCDLPRFDSALNVPWTVGGGPLRADITYRGCWMCGQVARRQFPGVPITGGRRLAEVFAADCRVPLAPHLLPPAGIGSTITVGELC